jgi:hypothetical protein
MPPEERKRRCREANKRYRETHSEQCRAYRQAYQAKRKPTDKQRAHRREYMTRYLKAYYELHKTEQLAIQHAKYHADIEAARLRSRTRSKKAYAIDPAKQLARSHKYLATENGRNKFQERYKETVHARNKRLREWKRRHPDRVSVDHARRRATRMSAMPPWTNAKDMRAVYKQAQRLTADTGIKHHVDHIVPLRGKTVCGLHVVWNLQVLTETENCRKSNKLIAA